MKKALQDLKAIIDEWLYNDGHLPGLLLAWVEIHIMRLPIESPTRSE